MQLQIYAKLQKARVAFAAAPLLLVLSSHCLADPMTLSSSALSSMVLGPSTDSLSLHAGSVSSGNSGGEAITFQSGDFLVGNSPIPDQIVPFSFKDSLTLNGITETLNMARRDDVTSTADTLSFFAGAPVVFGNEVLTLQPLSLIGTAVGEDLPIDLQGSMSPTPEPSSLVLLGTGLLAATLLATVSRRSLVESIPTTEAPIPLFNTPSPGRSWARRGTTLHPAASDGTVPSLNSPSVATSAKRPVAKDFEIDGVESFQK